MKKIDKNNFEEKIQNILVDNITPKILKSQVNEFKIGNNYFYEIVNEKLIDIHNWINNYFQLNIPLNNAAIAFRKEQSYLHFFEPHRKNYHFLRLDITSFFHSININDIKLIFSNFFEEDFLDEKKKQTLIDAFINLVTYKIEDNSPNEKFKGKQVLPMGFKTSPVISNIIFRKLDIQIQEFCSKRDIIYTRYADDMLFSSDEKMTYTLSDNFVNEISILISQMNFKLNKNKTIKSKHTLSLNGYTIQHSIFQKNSSENEDKEYKIFEFRLSNKKLYIIKKLIHLVNKENQCPEYILKKLFNYTLPNEVPNEKKEEYNNHQLVNKITGYRSYLLSIVIFNKKFDCCQNSTIKKYLEIVEDLNILIDKTLKF
jgi:hypothetical protein